MRGLRLVKTFAQQLEQHVREGQHAADRQSVAAGELLAALLRGREHREVGAEDVGRAVHQKDVVAFLEGTRCRGSRWRGNAYCGFGHGSEYRALAGGITPLAGL